jgi:hypothetical protein
MDCDATRGTTYRIVLRGELGDEFAFLFEDFHLERADGSTVLTGCSRDQAQLHGLLDQAQALGLELTSVQTLDEAQAGGADPAKERP